MEHSADLPKALKALGMSDPFDADRADFSRMSDQERLFIGAVKHKVRIGVDEEGTEAAAATAIVGGPGSAPLPEATMAIDRPFIYLVLDKNGVILFMGRLDNPLQGWHG